MEVYLRITGRFSRGISTGAVNTRIGKTTRVAILARLLLVLVIPITAPIPDKAKPLKVKTRTKTGCSTIGNLKSNFPITKTANIPGKENNVHRITNAVIKLILETGKAA